MEERAAMNNMDIMDGDSRLFTALSENVGEGVTLTDATGRFAIYSDQMKKISGYTGEEARTLDEYLALLYQDDVGGEKLMREVRNLFLRECRNRETVIRAKDGTPKSVYLSTSSVECQGGRFLLHAYRDVTSRKRAEENYLKAELRYQLLTEQLFDALVVIDPETVLPLYFNDKALEFFGYSKEEFPGIRIDRLETRGHFIKNKLRNKLLHAEAWDDIETEIYSKDAIIKNVKVSVRIVEISEKRLVQCVFHELTVGKRTVVKRDSEVSAVRNKPDREKALTGTVPICYVCKKICDDSGSWCQIEAYISERSNVLFSHELCPICEHRFYPKPLSARNKEIE